jgi:polysaccharide deacetylase family protein (PEP-CTERM system associated)
MALRQTVLPLFPEPQNVFTVDLEDWFHFEFGGFSVPFSSWGEMEGRVERGADQLLQLLDNHHSTATFFVLGWIAEKYPALIKKIADSGHEIGCHTYCHHLINKTEPASFRADLNKAKKILQDVSGQAIVGFRAPYFSIDQTSEWAFEILSEEGFLYDSSIFPAKRMIGGCPSGQTTPYLMHSNAGDLYEMPITVVEFLGKRFTMFGGGYFRLLPLCLVSAGIKRLNKKGIPVNFYIHPHDLDDGQPRAQMDPFSCFRRYVGLSKTGAKLNRMLAAHRFGTLEHYFRQFVR